MAAVAAPEHAEKLIDGNALAKSIRNNVRETIVTLKAKHPQFQPTLAIVQAGDRPDSSTYVRMKQKAAQEVGIEFRHCAVPAETSVQTLVDTVKALNADETVSGILVQLPLGGNILPEQEREITETISPEKDVDGFHAYNIGHLVSRASTPLFAPCTPAGCIALLESKDIQISGAIAVVLGRSDIVGIPVAAMLRSRDATVIQCHSKTRNIQDLIKLADIVVAAIGKANFVKGEWLKPGAVVVDVGINYVPDASKKSGQRLVGDVDISSALPVVSYITPVPGGVGPMTVAMLMSNMLQSATRQLTKDLAGHRVPNTNTVKSLVG